MDQIFLAENIIRCHDCGDPLVPHPIFWKSGAKMCPQHGDFFIVRQRGKKTRIVFRRIDVDEYEDMDPAILASRARNKSKTAVILRCNETGMVYDSVLRAARMMGLNKSSLSQHINGRTKSCGGYTFTRLERDRKTAALPEHVAKRLMTQTSFPKVRVRCVTTGLEFDSVVAAAVAYGVDRSNLSNHLNGRRKSLKGLLFEYIKDEAVS